MDVISKLKGKKSLFIERRNEMKEKIKKSTNEIELLTKKQGRLKTLIRKAELAIYNLRENPGSIPTKYQYNKTLTSKENNLKKKQEELESSGEKINRLNKMINMYNDKVEYCTKNLDNIYEELDKAIKNLSSQGSTDCWDDPVIDFKKIKISSTPVKKIELNDDKTTKKTIKKIEWWRNTPDNRPHKVIHAEW